MTWAPQSASWRTAVGPARTRVRSITVTCESAFEASIGSIRKDKSVGGPGHTTGEAHHLPVQRGGRLSMNARTPSRKSALP